MSLRITKPDNLLLQGLREEEWELVAEYLKPHHFFQGELLQRAGDDVRQSWFPCGSASAGFQVWADPGGDEPLDVGTIGREGALGGIVSQGRIPAYANAKVRDPGIFLSIEIQQLQRLKGRSPVLSDWFARYSDCLIARLFQNAACGASHTIRQRSARWLLDSSARHENCEIRLTQEEFAALLGVGRSFLTSVLRKMREEGLIETQRGAILLQDPNRLRQVACDCSEQIDDHYHRVMWGLYG